MNDKKKKNMNEYMNFTLLIQAKLEDSLGGKI